MSAGKIIALRNALKEYTERGSEVAYDIWHEMEWKYEYEYQRKNS